MALIDAPVFVPEGTDPQHLLDMAKACQDAYTGDQGKVITVGAYQAILTDVSGKNVIAIRGSANARDWIADFDFIPALWHGNFVHRGFLGAYNTLKPYIQDLKAEIITGHSLGGAIATLAALELGASELVTFGSPKVGWRGLRSMFAMAYHLKSTRVVHSLDIVPTMPPFPFEHIIDPTVVNDDGSMGDQGTIVKTRDLAQFKADFDGKAESDHFITNYIAALSKAVAQTPIKVA